MGDQHAIRVHLRSRRENFTQKRFAGRIDERNSLKFQDNLVTVRSLPELRPGLASFRYPSPTQSSFHRKHDGSFLFNGSDSKHV